MYLFLHVKCLIITKFWFTRQISIKNFNIEFHKNPSIGSRVCRCGRTDRRKVMGAFRDFCEDTRKHDVDMVFSDVIVIPSFRRLIPAVSRDACTYCFILQQMKTGDSTWTLDSPNHSWFQTFAVFSMLYVFFWVIPRRLNFICRRFRTLCLFHLHRQEGK
jgi:hypothetical protein